MPAQGEPAQEREVLPPDEGAAATGAVRARLHDALALGPAAEAHVQEAAEGQPEQRRHCRAENADH